jgi:glycosyltransferase involved in cell wall biosynthesis
VIPCWNGAAYVGRAISSALRQTHTDCEVIVVDDGSTDGSLQVIRAFGDRVRWKSGPNRGGCAARNAGLEMASGEFVQFLDADDWLHPEKVAKQLAHAGDDPEAVTYSDHFVREFDDASSERLRAWEGHEPDSVVFVLRHRSLCITGPLHRRERLVSVGGFKEGLRASQEFDLHLRLAVDGARFRRVPEPLFTICRRPDSVSSDTGRTMACLLDILPHAVEALRQAGALNDRRRAEFADYSARAARLCMRYGWWREGLGLLRFAETLDLVAAERGAYGPSARVLKRLAGPRAVEVAARIRRWGQQRLAGLRHRTSKES